MEHKMNFGKTKNGQRAGLYVLKNNNGMQAHITDYGATLVKLLVPDKDGNVRDVVLGYEDVSGYENGTCFFGTTIGRFANRIGGAKFDMNGETYHLEQNDGANTLHGGRDFYSKRIWQAEAVCENTIMFGLDSQDSDQGFPGGLHIDVTYHLSEENELRITYHANWLDDAVFATPLNLTNHSYFNLNGHDGGSVLGHDVTIHAEEFTPCAPGSIPTGEIRSLEGSPLDFRMPKKIGEDIEADCDQLKMAGGYDHNYVLNFTPAAQDGLIVETQDDRETIKLMDGMCKYREVAKMYSEDSGIHMSVYTDLPGLQFYTANYVDGEQGKDGAVYGRRSSACFETQFWPDCVNKENFPGGVLKSGEEFFSLTIYKFSV